MIIKLPFKYRVRIYASRLEKRIGVCSKEAQGNRHILLWDFDSAPLAQVTLCLKDAQVHYCLPNIYIIESSFEHYHAYCFAARTFRQVVEILVTTSVVDMAFLRMGVTRGFFTLRISPRKGENFKIVKVLLSSRPDEINPLDVTVNEYLTSNKGGHHA